MYGAGGYSEQYYPPPAATGGGYSDWEANGNGRLSGYPSAPTPAYAPQPPPNRGYGGGGYGGGGGGRDPPTGVLPSEGAAGRFRVRLVSDSPPETVVVAVGLDGVRLMDASGTRALRTYALDAIVRWSVTEHTAVTLYTRAPGDGEERAVRLAADGDTIRSLVDVLTCCCIQLADLLSASGGDASRGGGGGGGGGGVGGGRAQVSSVGGGVAQAQAQAAAVAAINARDGDVQFWTQPDKAGYLTCQGEVLKTWRRRWFVLKHGRLFRFLSPDVSSSSKPRGVHALGRCSAVTAADAALSRPHALALALPEGTTYLLADSAAERDEWYSALEHAMQTAVAAAAGVALGGGGSQDYTPVPAKAAPSSSSSAPGGGLGGAGGRSHTDWMKALQEGYSSVERPADRGTGGGYTGYSGGGGGSGYSGGVSYGAYGPPGAEFGVGGGGGNTGGGGYAADTGNGSGYYGGGGGGGLVSVTGYNAPPAPGFGGGWGGQTASVTVLGYTPTPSSPSPQQQQGPPSPVYQQQQMQMQQQMPLYGGGQQGGGYGAPPQQQQQPPPAWGGYAQQPAPPMHYDGGQAQPVWPPQQQQQQQQQQGW